VAELSKDPKHWELEHMVAAHFTSRGCFVEQGVTLRDPDDVSDIDVVWTDYRSAPLDRRPVEVKSGEWGIGDLLKFYGWTRFLGLAPGQFAHREEPRREKDKAVIARLGAKTGIELLHVAKDAKDVSAQFASWGLPEPAQAYLPGLWRFSYWARKRLFDALQQGIKRGICPKSGEQAKEYRRLVNDAVFFEPDVRSRFGSLISAHFQHRMLAKTAAAETEGQGANFDDPPSTETFKRALYYGHHLPVQACFYLTHRARLYVLKTAVDYWAAREAGQLPRKTVIIGGTEFAWSDAELTRAFSAAVENLCGYSWFPLLPVFWQTFLWAWGGFLLRDRLDQEYAALSAQTGIPEEAIPTALTAFDRFFPIAEAGGWFRDVTGEQRRTLKQMPAAMRGIGAHQRRLLFGVEQYSELGFTDWTTNRLTTDNNTVVRLLEGDEEELAK